MKSNAAFVALLASLNIHRVGLSAALAQATYFATAMLLVFPLLTVVGVWAGAWIAALTSGEFRWRRPRKPLKNFVYGMVVMNAALLAAGCSIRLLLRTSAGDLLGAAGFAAMAAGVVLATFWLRRRALR